MAWVCKCTLADAWGFSGSRAAGLGCSSGSLLSGKERPAQCFLDMDGLVIAETGRREGGRGLGWEKGRRKREWNWKSK